MTENHDDFMDFPVPGMIRGNFSKEFLLSLGFKPISPGLMTQKVTAIQSTGKFYGMELYMKYCTEEEQHE